MSCAKEPEGGVSVPVTHEYSRLAFVGMSHEVGNVSKRQSERREPRKER